MGFPELDDDQRVFTNSDVAVLSEVAGLVAADMVDADELVDLARPLGNLMSRLAAAQTSFVSQVLGGRIAAGRAVDDPRLPSDLAAQALAATEELLPVLEQTTLHVWRRHLAAEVGRPRRERRRRRGSRRTKDSGSIKSCLRRPAQKSHVDERLTLRYVSDDLGEELAIPAAQGLHDPAPMPFSTPWTDVDSPELERNTLRFYWRNRAETTVTHWRLNLAAIVEGSVLGDRSARPRR